MDTRIVENEADMLALGARLGAVLCPGDVVAFAGGLGAGQTTLARGLVQGSLPTEIVPSPTYTLVQTYDFPNFTLWHCDLYRLEDEEDVLEIGLEEAFADAVTLIEWADRLGGWLPHRRLSVAFAGEDWDESRRIVLDGDSDWRERLEGLMANAAT